MWNFELLAIVFPDPSTRTQFGFTALRQWGFLVNVFRGKTLSLSQLLERFEFLEPMLELHSFLLTRLFCQTSNSSFAMYLLERFGPFCDVAHEDDFCNMPSLKAAASTGRVWWMKPDSRDRNMVLPTAIQRPASHLEARQVLDLVGKIPVGLIEADTLTMYLQIDRNAFLCGEDGMMRVCASYTADFGLKRTVARLQALRLMNFPWNYSGIRMNPKFFWAAFCAGLESPPQQGFECRDEWLLWSERSHRYYSESMKIRIWTTLLSWKRLCGPFLPRDLRRLLIGLIADPP
jgi:hypothetical protein